MSRWRIKKNISSSHTTSFTVVGPNNERARMPIGDLLTIIDGFGYSYHINHTEIAIFTPSGSIELEVR